MLALGGLLARVGEDDPATRGAKLRTFEVILLLHICAEHWSWYLDGHTGWLRPVLALPLVAAGVFLRWTRLPFLGLLVLHAFVIADTFPQTANHVWLEALLFGILAFLDHEEEAEQGLILGSVRWIVLVVFFYAGLQKLVHGFYVKAQLLAVYMRTEKFQAVLQYLVPDDELARLTALDSRVGDGPYRVESPLLVLVSNASYIVEMGVPCLLLFRKTRTVGLLLALGFLVATEAMARELFFGALYLNGLLLFVPGDLRRRSLPAFALFYVWLVLIRLGLLPEVTFH